jgi:hypothetical protein
MKICSTCKKEFTKDSGKKDGLKINCIECCKLYTRQYYKKNIKKEKERG